MVISLEEFMRNAKDVSDVEGEIIKKLEAEEYPFAIGHKAQLERDRDWSILNQRLVTDPLGEEYPFQHIPDKYK